VLAVAGWFEPKREDVVEAAVAAWPNEFPPTKLFIEL